MPFMLLVFPKNCCVCAEVLSGVALNARTVSHLLTKGLADNVCM